MDLSVLKYPFREEEIEWRIGTQVYKNNKVYAMALAYVTARAIQDRLDFVVGPENWKDEYELTNHGVFCRLSVRVPSVEDSDGNIIAPGEWVTKMNGSPETAIESFKGGISKAFVRAASNWGIGRYLYKLENNWVKTSLERVSGWESSVLKGHGKDVRYWWQRPELPKWALPNE